MRIDNFDRNFNRMNRIFWIMFGVVATFILCVWLLIGTAIFTVISNPGGVAKTIGNFAAEVIKPIAEATKEAK